MRKPLTAEQTEKKNRLRRERRAAKAAAEGRTLRAAPNGKKREENRAAKKAAKRAAMALPKVRTGTPEYRRAIQMKFGAPEMTKGDLRRMMEAAMANTAAMPVEDAR